MIAGLPFFNPQSSPKGPSNTVVATAATATVPPLLSPIDLFVNRAGTRFPSAACTSGMAPVSGLLGRGDAGARGSIFIKDRDAIDYHRSYDREVNDVADLEFFT